VSKDSDQTQTAPRKFKLGPLGSLNQVTKGLAKTIRAMADGTLDSQVGARICNGLGIMRACLETQKLEQLEARMDEIADRVARDRNRVARDRTSAARERTSNHEAQRPSY
jgi:glutamate synthase domain-containing protein 2